MLWRGHRCFDNFRHAARGVSNCHIDGCRILKHAGEHYRLGSRVIRRGYCRRCRRYYSAIVAAVMLCRGERDCRCSCRPLFHRDRRRCCGDAGYRFRGYGFFPKVTNTPAVFLTSVTICGQLADFINSASDGDAPLSATAVPPSPVFFGLALVVLFHA